MDLNNLRPPPPESPKPLRVVRLSPRNEEVETEVFDGGESLPESQGFDVGHPISPEEREALIASGYSEDDIDIIGEGGPEFDVDDGMDIDLSHLDPASRAGAEYTREVIRDLQIRESAAKALAEHERYVAENFHVRMCPLPTCDAGVRVAKGEDEGDVLGIGMSMKAAMQLEEELVGHLREHTLGDWMAALKEQAEMISRLGQQAFGGAPVPQPGVFRASEEATQRSPEAQAAVDALDARMRSKAGGTGGLRPPPPPEEAAQRDQRLRELRRQRRERQPSPYDLSPKYSADPSFSGQVGIKY